MANPAVSPTQRFCESYPSHHQAGLTRGVHPSDLMRVNPKQHKPLRRHLSDRTAEQRRIYVEHEMASSGSMTVRAPVQVVVSPQSSGYASTDVGTATGTKTTTDYPHWRSSNGRTDVHPTGNTRGTTTIDHKLSPRHDSLNDLRHYLTTDHGPQFLHKKRSANSLDQNSYSEGSQSSFTGSLVDQSNHRISSEVLQDRYVSPSSSQSDFSDCRYQSRYSSRTSNYYSLPRSRSSLTAGSHVPVEDKKQGSYNHPSGVIIGNVWPVEEEDGPFSPKNTNLSRTFNATDDLYLTHHDPPNYLPQSPTSPSFSSEADNEELPWYEQENPNIHSGIFFPTPVHVPPAGYHRAPRPHSYHQSMSLNTTTDRTLKPSTSFNEEHKMRLPDSDEDRVFDVNEQKILSQQRLARYFSHSSSEKHSSLLRRESSPTQLCVEHEKKSHKQTNSKIDEGSSPKQKKIPRNKSGALGKLVKKLSGRKADKSSKENMKNMKALSSSSSNLEGLLRNVRRSQSMEHMQLVVPRGNGKSTTPTPSPGTTPKMPRGLFRARRNSEPDLENFGTLFRSNSKKNLASEANLFEAIEGDDFEQCRYLLENNDVAPDLSSPNDDGWTPLDLAVMISEKIANLLLSHGAKTSQKYLKEPELRYHHVLELLKKFEGEMKYFGGTSHGNGSKEMNKQLSYLTNRVLMLRRMKSNIEKANVPGSPREVQLTVTSAQSLSVKFFEPESNNGAVVTRYRIQWSRKEQFGPEVGEFVICDVRNKEYTIPGLENGEKYFVRVSAFNMKGYGPPRASIPVYGTPSNWHDIDSSQPRYLGNTTQMGIVATKMNQLLLQEDFTSVPPGTPASTNRRNIFTKLFGQGVKFHKVLKTGVYLSSIIYSDEGRVLVTMDDNLPVVEVSDSHPSSVNSSDFAWLAKVACTWENIQDMCDVSDNYTSSPAIQLRNKILHALLMLQDGTGQHDLGLLHHCSYQDSHGSKIFVFVQYIDDYKSLQGVNIKWTSMAKLKRKLPQVESETNELAVDQLLRDLPYIIHHHTQCSHILPRGLYLGYLKARVSSKIGSMTVVTSSTLPNVLPYYKIRTNPNISLNEWAWLQSLCNESTSDKYDDNLENQMNNSLQKNLLPSIEHFLEILGISNELNNTQLYTQEVVELNENVTFLLLLPSPENVCTPPGSTDQFEGPKFSHMPITTFELLQLYTYQRAFILKFTEVSARLDIELLISQKKRREAFSKADLASAKEQHEQLQAIHDDTEHVWKQIRWIETALQTGRDVSLETRLSIQQLRDKTQRTHVRSLTSSMSLTSTSSSGTLSPVRKAVTNVLPATARYIRVFPAYETGLAKGTSVKIFVTAATTTDEVILVTVEQLEKARRERGIPGQDIRGRDLADFYLVAVLGHNHREEVLAPKFTPLQLLNYSIKYKFIVRRWSLDQLATEV